jgi:hypothetical protein
MSTAGRAYRKNFRPKQIVSAFRRRGFVADAEQCLQGQQAVLAQLQEHVNCRQWAQSQVDTGKLPKYVLDLPAMQDRRKSGRHRQPLGPGLSPLGVLNSDEKLEGLVRLLDQRKRDSAGGKPKRKRRKKPD